jgi:hypothetical protein
MKKSTKHIYLLLGILLAAIILAGILRFEGFTGGEQPGLLVVNNFDYTRKYPRDQITDNKTI